MSIDRRDIMQMLRDEIGLLKSGNQHLGRKVARLQQAFRVLIDIDEKTALITSQMDLPALFNQLLELVLHACNSENGSLIMVDEALQELEFVDVIGTSRDALLNHRIKIDTGIVGNVIKTGEAVLVDNVHASKKWSSTIDESLNFHTSSLICAPLKINNRIVGAVEVVNQKGDSDFDENDLNVIKVAACYVGRALERAEQLILSAGGVE